MKLPLAILLTTISFAGYAWAQVDAPLLGYLPDGPRIRPIYGIPESAIVAPPLDAGPFARIATSGETVLASREETGAVVQYRNGAFHAVPGVSPSPDLIVLSPSGSSAVLWFTSRSIAEIVTGLRAEPRVRQVHAPFRPTTPTLAISDDGEWLAGIWSGGLFVFGRDRQPAPIRIDGRPRELAFSTSGQLAVATSDGVYAIADIGGNATVSAVHATTPRPAAIAYAGSAVIAAGASGAIVENEIIDCRCQPESLTPLIPGVFLLRGLHSGAALLYDSRTGKVHFAALSLQEASR